jgi:hypothetical protein
MEERLLSEACGTLDLWQVSNLLFEIEEGLIEEDKKKHVQ